MAVLLCAIFFASGASALVFETLWFHQAGLAFGNGVWASSLVLSGFMAGLALGNAAAARWGDRLGDPVRAYALAEVAIAATGVGLVLLLPQLGAWLAPVARPLLDLPWVLNPLRLVLALLLLLVPSTAMGLTLPLLTSVLAHSPREFGPMLGRLYGWNTLGAVVGVVATEAVLLGALGIRGTAVAAGALNLAIAVVAAVVARRRAGNGSGQRATSGPILRWRDARRPLAAAFASGFAILALEVVWFRFLSLFILDHAFSFALILAAVLTGIALGGLAASVWLGRDPRAHRFAAPLAFAAGAACIASYALFPLPLGTFLAEGREDVGAILLLAIPLMLPVSAASGIFFTLLGAAVRDRLPSETTAAGALTTANTIGAALGSLAGGFALLPWLGMERSLFALALLYGVVGIALAVASGAGRRSLWTAGATFALAAALFPFGAMERFLRTPVDRVAAPGDRIAAVREGLVETVIYVESHALGGVASHRMITNAYSMSGTDYFSRRYMKLYVYWPVAIHPAPRDALLISFGVGATAKALTDTAALERIDVVDISRDVLDLAEVVFPDPATHPLNDPRVEVHVEDGRYFLQTTERRYDLITGEPPPPDMAGVVNLYTSEYFTLMRERLREGGIATYWLPIHSMSDRGSRAVIRAFCEAFADCSLWHGSGSDLMLVGSRGAQPAVPAERLTAQWRDPAVAPELAALGFERPSQLGALFIADAPALRRLTDADAPVADDWPRRITASPTSAAAQIELLAWFTDVDAARSRFEASEWIADLWPEALRRASLDEFRWQRIINGHFFGARDPDRSTIVDLHAVLREAGLRAPVLWLLGSSADHQAVLDRAGPEAAARPDHALHHGIRLLSERDYAGAIAAFGAAERDPDLRRIAVGLRLYTLAMDGQRDAARRLAREVRGELGAEGRLAAYWRLLRDEFGIDPQAVDLAAETHP